MTDIKPFHIDIPQAVLDRRLDATLETPDLLVSDVRQFFRGIRR